LNYLTARSPSLSTYPYDHFEIRLIDAVEKNPCIFNRCHPLHKMSDYKSHVWNQVAQQLSFTGPGVELERKWRHMRDRYVRLRKIDKTSTPLKKGDKWYYYYKKMSFLDPYIEHRNRRKRGDLMASLRIFYVILFPSNTSSKKRKLEENHEDYIPDTEVFAYLLNYFFQSFSLSSFHSSVSLFVRSIEKSLNSMDARTFALARLEISRVLYDCQYGDRKTN
uniref:MADF domain-containing protein n=1 Tax=Angiostrongylus cantonensis TaxID=6313 RepID=A0A0K0CUG5_ANGCA